MFSARLRIALPAAALIGLAAAPAAAQRPLSAEQRIMMLEHQLSASQAAATRLEQRLDSIERQLQQLINQGEVNGHRISELQSEIAKLRSDTDSRLTALESRPVPEPATAAVGDGPQRTETKPERSATATPTPKPSSAESEAVEAATTSDPGEDAYSEGFRLWRDGSYDRAVTALRAFLSGFPNHRRASFARNLIGRALLDKGQPRPAAEALLANYRTDPKGERAPDSLYYLGQALMKLDQPGQACKAYAELEEVYGSSIRSDLKAMVNEGKADARCS